MSRIILYFAFLLLLSSCGQSDKSVENTNSKILFEEIKPIQEQLNPNIQINLSKLVKDNSFVNNITNNNGNINFEPTFEKKKTFKFSKIKQFNSIDTDILFIENNDLIYFDNKGTILRINEKFETLWKANHYSKKERKLNPILYFNYIDNKIIAADTLSNIFSLNLDNGELNWKKDSLSPFNSNIAIKNDKFVTVDFDNVIRCFSIKNGQELWYFKTENSFIKSQQKLSLIISNNRVIFINTLGDVSSVDINNGNLLWQTPTQSTEVYESSFSIQNSDLIAAKKNIFFSNNKNQFFALDERTGDIKWRQTINSNLRPTYIQGLIFTISLEGYLVIIDGRNGNIVRMTNIFDKIKNYEKKGLLADKKTIKPVGFIVSKDKIYTSLNNGKIIIVDILTGKSLEVVKIDSEKISRPYIFNNEMFVIRDNAILKLN